VEGKCLVLGLIMVVVVLAQPVFALSNFDVKFVSYVEDYGKYIPTEPIFGKGDKVSVYAQVKDINHMRAYAVDFVFVVYDPKGYVVSGGSISKSDVGWADNAYAVYNFKIPEDWITGKYKVEVYVFDVLNSTATYKEYKSLKDKILSGEKFSVQVYKVSRSDVDYLKKTIEFKVVNEKKSNVLVFNSRLKARVLPVGMNNSLEVSLYNSGNKEADFFARLFVDGEKISKQEVILKPKEFKEIGFKIPQLKEGTHKISLTFDWDSLKFKKVLPIVVGNFLFDKPILVSKYGKGVVVLSQNNYVLGSLKSKMNRENADRMLANILAYSWKKVNGSGDIKTGIYISSDKEARDSFGEVLEDVAKLSDAPIRYKGIVEADELNNLNVLFYISKNPVIKSDLSQFVENGGILIVESTDYWFNPDDIVKKYHLNEDPEIYTSFFDLANLNKTVNIRLKTELKLPPELEYSNLTVSKFLVSVGTPVKISFDVHNVGGAGKKTVRVYANDELIYNRTFSFYTNEKKHIEFEFTPKKESAYRITVVNKERIGKVFFAKNFTKSENKTPLVTPTPEVKQRRNGILITAIAGVLALLIALRIYVGR